MFYLFGRHIVYPMEDLWDDCWDFGGDTRVVEFLDWVEQKRFMKTPWDDVPRGFSRNLRRSYMSNPIEIWLKKIKNIL